MLQFVLLFKSRKITAVDAPFWERIGLYHDVFSMFCSLRENFLELSSLDFSGVHEYSHEVSGWRMTGKT